MQKSKALKWTNKLLHFIQLEKIKGGYAATPEKKETDDIIIVDKPISGPGKP